MILSDEDIITDLKQFIVATVSQAVAPLADDIGQLKTDVSEIKLQLNDMDSKIDTVADAHAEDLIDHERRITQLEHRAT